MEFCYLKTVRSEQTPARDFVSTKIIIILMPIKKKIIIKNKCRKMFFVRLKSKSLVLPARISLTTSVEFFPLLLIFSFSFLFLYFRKKTSFSNYLFSVCSCTTLIFVIFQIVLCRYIHYTRKTFLSFKF